MEIQLRAQIIVGSENMEMQSSFDAQIKEPPNISREFDNENRQYCRSCSSDDEWSTAADQAGGPVAQVADQRLNEETGKRSAEPNHAGILIGDSELLYVWC
ncbi:hypothetical protein LOK49_LG12G01823 [Camellia lanceoleosa]|uniref:Uncharacterized protein n=1 Tax=Camellia lanceoleosa TaxID=1840588 RepID=A0ACC0FXV3_9ERIC|nr:hypothetical protein LOK49_LG12G01823 [Camellia lanceoleosa]